jgi:hypothetical protein
VSGRDLSIEDTAPFTLHYGHDRRQDIADPDSAPGRFGLHTMTLAGAEMGGWTTVDSKRRHASGWEQGDDHHVRIVPTAHPRLRLRSGAM